MESQSDQSDSEENNYKGRLSYFAHFFQKTPLILVAKSNKEICLAQKNELRKYELKKNKLFKIETKEFKETIKDIIYLNNDLLISTKEGYIIILEENEEIKKIKFKNNPIFYSLLDLEDNNLICGFSLDCLNIIDIKKSSIISSYKFNSNGINNKIDEDKFGDPYDYNGITVDTFDRRSKPFILKNQNEKFICFKLINSCVIINYKNMKVIQKINFDRNTSFQLYQPRDKHQFFYVILLKKQREKNLEIQKYSNNAKLVEKYEANFEFPIPEESKDPGADDSYDSDLIDLDEESIYKCIIKDIKNFSFLYHIYYSSPAEYELFISYDYKNGLMKKKAELKYSYFNCNEPHKDYEIKEFGKLQFLAEGNEKDGIQNVKIIK